MAEQGGQLVKQGVLLVVGGVSPLNALKLVDETRVFLHAQVFYVHLFAAFR